ncbi:MAG: hypothetical protein NZ828_03300 [Alphaproteobacteria bacterium]|nr:hypothetical protein [Alphaproteobacteria bacterium]
MNDKMKQDFPKVVKDKPDSLQEHVHDRLTRMALGIVAPEHPQAIKLGSGNSFSKVAGVINDSMSTIDMQSKILFLEFNKKVAHCLILDPEGKIAYDSMDDTGQTVTYDSDAKTYAVGQGGFVFNAASEVKIADFKTHYLDGLSTKLNRPSIAVTQNLTQ